MAVLNCRMDVEELNEIANSLEKTMIELGRDIQLCKERKDSVREVVLRDQYFDLMETKQMLSGLYKLLKGGKDEVVYPTA